MIMLAAGIALVATRMFLGPGSAILAALFFLAVRGTLTLLVGPVLGETTPALPLYLAEAILVELIALRLVARPLAFGMASGVAIGTVGLAAEWGWTHAVMHQPWPSELFPEGAIFGFLAAMVGATLGAWIGTRLKAETFERPPVLRPLAVVAAAVLSVMVVVALRDNPTTTVRADVTVTEVQGGAERTGDLTVRLDPPDAADDAEWFTVTAWQGGGSMVEPLERTGPGQYATTEPVPLYGTWKSLLRLHRDNELSVAPVFLPADEAIPAPEVPARPQFTREFVAEPQILLREQTGGGGVVWGIAYAIVGLIALSLLVLIAWGLHRLAITAGAGGPRPTEPDGERTGARVSPARTVPA
jgi:hypothetical protein